MQCLLSSIVLRPLELWVNVCTTQTQQVERERTETCGDSDLNFNSRWCTVAYLPMQNCNAPYRERKREKELDSPAQHILNYEMCCHSHSVSLTNQNMSLWVQLDSRECDVMDAAGHWVTMICHPEGFSEWHMRMISFIQLFHMDLLFMHLRPLQLDICLYGLREIKEMWPQKGL